MKQASYKRFSLTTHLTNLSRGRPNSCQLELTYACGLRCLHCYVSGYNRPSSIRRELKTASMMKIMDELKSAGVLWICFTGGDPLVRPDFGRLYRYACEQGFLVTVFTNGYSLNKDHIDLFRKYPPFCIEITLNGVHKELYETMAGVQGSFEKVMAGIAVLRRYGLPLKLKAMVTSLNRGHIPEIKRYARAHKLRLILDGFLHAGLDGDSRPLQWRLPPDYFHGREVESRCVSLTREAGDHDSLFPCVATSGDGFQISPYGHISACCLIRHDDLNVARDGFDSAFRRMRKYFQKMDVATGSKCRGCAKRDICGWCPGKALVETGSVSKPIDYCCEIAKGYD